MVSSLLGTQTPSTVLDWPRKANMRVHPHEYYERLLRPRFGDEAIPLSPAPGAAVITVGAGLLMATCDALVGAGVPVHCAVDVGRLPDAQKASLLDWAAWVDQHTCLVVHTWHSRSAASRFVELLQDHYPDLLAGRTPVPVCFRVRGLGEEALPAALVNHWRIETLIEAVTRTIHAQTTDGTTDAHLCAGPRGH